MDTKVAFKKGIVAGIPIALGYFAVAFTFGMMAVQGGLSIGQSVLISLTNVTSAGQFAGLDIILAQGTLWEMALTQLIINLRYCLMSLAISQKLDKRFKFFHRFFIAFGMTDEIFGVSAASPGKSSPFFHYGAMLVAIPGWTIGTLVGAVAGSVLPAKIISALNVAIYGMFLAIIIPPCKENKAIAFAVAASFALSSAAAFIPAIGDIPSGIKTVALTVIVSVAAAILFPIKFKTDIVKEGD